MTRTAIDDDARGTASVLINTPGVPWWGAVLIAIVPTAIGFGIDLSRSGALGVVSWALTLIGIITATLAVRRRSVFTAMVQPPLVIAGALVAAYLITVNTRVLGIGLALINSFPLMLVATALAVILGLVRVIAQPLGGRRVARG